MKICIDAGHGGSDPGAIGREPFEVREKDINMGVALLLERELEKRGHWVNMTRRRDRKLSLGARARHANRLDADLFISIHANAGHPSAEGMEVFHFPGSVGGRKVARSIQDQLMAAFPDHRDRGVKEANFAVLRLTMMPAVLVECEFLTNPGQLEFLAHPDNQERLAAVIAEGFGAASE